MLVPELRARWDEATLAPTHHKARAASRLLVDLHAGRHVAPCDVDPGHVFTALPLAWSIELACRLHADRHPGGARLARGSSTRFPKRRGPSCATWPSRESNGVAKAANDLLAHLPAVPSQQVEICVLGPMQVTFDGVTVDT